jgi:hypothetical protein
MSEIITSTVTTTTTTALEEQQPPPSLGRKRIHGRDSDTNKKQRKSSEDNCFEAARLACQRVERGKHLYEGDHNHEEDDWNAYTSFSPQELSSSTELTKTAIRHLTLRIAELQGIEAQIHAKLQATRDQLTSLVRQDFLILGKLVMVEHIRSLKRA